MRFLLLFSRQGKLRLQKWFTPMSDREKKKIIRDMTSMVLSRQPRSCNFLQWKDLKIIYKRWALPWHVCITYSNDLLCFWCSENGDFCSYHGSNCFVFNVHLLSVCLLLKIIPVPPFPQVRQSVFLFGCGAPGKWAVSPGGHSSLRGTARQILWQCTSSCFTLLLTIKTVMVA